MNESMVAMLLVYDCSKFLEISIMTQKRAQTNC